MRPTVLVLALSICLPLVAFAQWQPDGIAVSTAVNHQNSPRIVSDGAGGAIVVWQDTRNAGAYDIYAQRVNAAGVPQWTADGVALCIAMSDQFSPTIASDAAGGAIVTWNDARGGSYDIYAQRVNAAGAPQWAANGVALSTAVNDQNTPAITSDGAGGAIVTWFDARSGSNYDIYAQRVNASGAPQWIGNGVPLCAATNNQYSPTIAADGAGGAIATWYDGRSGVFDIYAQRVNASGAPQWTLDGVAVCTATSSQFNPTLVSDGAGGAIVTWYDHRSGASDIFIQWVNAAGVPQWFANGVALCIAANDQYNPRPVSDGAGGAIVTWRDFRSGATDDIYAQRVNASGSPQWIANGVALCTAAFNQFDPTPVSDGAGGAIVTWQDDRSGANYDIYAQRVNGSGAPQWIADGVALSTAASVQSVPTIASDGVGGAIVAWQDTRSGTEDIYAQRVEPRYGYWGHPEPQVTSVADIPGDQGGRVKLNWTASGRDVANLQTISHYSIWRATDAVAAASAAAAGGAVTNPSAIPIDFKGRAVWTQHGITTDYYWEWVGNQDAHYRVAYSFSTATRSDSTSEGTSQHQFFVSAQTSDPYVFFDSNVMSGHSVDNLAPLAPLMLTAQRVGSNVQLRWNRVRVPDLRDYSLYRATSNGVTPVPINFLTSSEDTVLIDTGAPTSALYYIVTAFDVHENQSAPSNEASVGATTGVGNTPPITALTVLDNMPNPFAGSTTLRIGLPRVSDVEIEVFDVAGRMVRSERTNLLAAGWRDVSFDGRDARGKQLVSGVYFYRVKAAGATITRKMVIAR